SGSAASQFRSKITTEGFSLTFSSTVSLSFTKSTVMPNFFAISWIFAEKNRSVITARIFLGCAVMLIYKKEKPHGIAATSLAAKNAAPRWPAGCGRGAGKATMKGDDTEPSPDRSAQNGRLPGNLRQQCADPCEPLGFLSDVWNHQSDSAGTCRNP